MTAISFGEMPKIEGCHIKILFKKTLIEFMWDEN